MTGGEQCPRCRGEGVVYRPESGGGFGFNPGNRIVAVSCASCKGSGQVPKKEAKS